MINWTEVIECAIVTIPIVLFILWAFYVVKKISE